MKFRVASRAGNVEIDIELSISERLYSVLRAGTKNPNPELIGLSPDLGLWC